METLKTSTSTMFPERRFTKECEHTVSAMREPYASQRRAGKEAGEDSDPVSPTVQPKQHLSNELYDKIAAVHNSSMGHWGHAKCKLMLNDTSVSDRMISTFIRQCPCCQVMSRLKVHIKTHPSPAPLTIHSR